MTPEELDATIAKIIIPQEKPLNTGNSHRRKQWENRKNWRLCTIGQSCKIGFAKSCKFAKQKRDKLLYPKNPLCMKCYCNCLSSIWWSGGVYNHDCTWYKKRYDTKYHWDIQRKSEHKLRHYKGDIINGSHYKKLFIHFLDRW